jgi:hypothetical protein
MTESLPGIQRRITSATGTPTSLNRPGVAPADPAEGHAGVEPVVETAAAEAPILITEQQVLFSSAAAVSISSKKTADERAAKHRHYPQHYVFLEQALMAREMERC